MPRRSKHADFLEEKANSHSQLPQIVGRLVIATHKDGGNRHLFCARVVLPERVHRAELGRARQRLQVLFITNRLQR